uniref:Uncharacterized protein n=1 Tax=Zooxanthella nutricula TaxID=1333877 RepID=A0A7S2M915_9DINO|mmetsp:Transcript_74592/g.228252  ORF Transcript_74592/g.228252 Transcript_74592/m.228252 type:complete len:460 (+) Transcript_74592:386-1765(+)
MDAALADAQEIGDEDAGMVDSGAATPLVNEPPPPPDFSLEQAFTRMESGFKANFLSLRSSITDHVSSELAARDRAQQERDAALETKLAELSKTVDDLVADRRARSAPVAPRVSVAPAHDAEGPWPLLPARSAVCALSATTVTSTCPTRSRCSSRATQRTLQASDCVRARRASWRKRCREMRSRRPRCLQGIAQRRSALSCRTSRPSRPCWTTRAWAPSSLWSALRPMSFTTGCASMPTGPRATERNRASWASFGRRYSAVGRCRPGCVWRRSSRMVFSRSRMAPSRGRSSRSPRSWVVMQPRPMTRAGLSSTCPLRWRRRLAKRPRRPPRGSRPARSMTCAALVRPLAAFVLLSCGVVHDNEVIHLVDLQHDGMDGWAWLPCDPHRLAHFRCHGVVLHTAGALSHPAGSPAPFSTVCDFSLCVHSVRLASGRLFLARSYRATCTVRIALCVPPCLRCVF